MFHKKYLIILFLLAVQNIFAQVENVPADNPVYSFLNQMKIRGVLEKYNNVILPLSKKEVIEALLSIDKRKTELNDTELNLLNNFKIKFNAENEEVHSFIGSPLPDIPGELSSYNKKHLYYYADENIRLHIDPVVELKHIYSSKYDKSASLINLGGRAYGIYDDWFGFYLEGTNGIVKGNRDAALTDSRIEQSFTFNHTRINYFDETQGYLKFHKGIIDFQLGRERLLWGTGNINRLMLSDNAPLFDFIKFDISYKSFSYKFIHGWLIQKPNYFFVDSLSSNRNKEPKYIAVSRLGFSPSSSVNLGISQVIIYSNRPFEAAYLNPFLFWESAQRSMNDLDNSYLSFDGKFLITKGIELNGNIIFDDINLEEQITKGNWDATNNRIAWQTGAAFTYPFFIKNGMLEVEYLQLRPFMFSHYGIGEALTYSNNGYLLGVNLQPNSTRFSTRLNYWLSSRIKFELLYHYSLHGNNIYNEKGELIDNVGGDFLSIEKDDGVAPLLDGELETMNEIYSRLEWEFIYGLFLNFEYRYFRSSSALAESKDNIVNFGFKVLFE